MTNKDYKSASSGSPILKYFNKWKYNEKENEDILKNSRINISKLVKLYSEINKYNSERSPKKLSKHLWNWSELLFNIYCINQRIDLKDLLKFNKFLYHYKFTKNFKKIENQDLEYFQKNWEELGRKNTNKESIYTKRIELYNLILGNINKTIPKNIKDKLRLNHFRTTNKLNCTTCINDDKNIINKNNFHCGHIISRNNGGIIHEVNLRPICGFCNSSMGGLDMDVYCQNNGVKNFYW